MLKKNLFLLLFAISAVSSRAGGDSLIAFVFLAEGCPICQSITPALNKLHTAYSDKNLKIIGLFPSAISTDSSRAVFAKKYKISFELLADQDGQLAKKFNATITPEVVLLSSSGEAVIYRGLIDDSFAAVGKRRKVSKNQYLKNAIEIFFTTFEPSTFTHPVGCKITLKP
jgi:peroxiredoxin